MASPLLEREVLLLEISSQGGRMGEKRFGKPCPASLTGLAKTLDLGDSSTQSVTSNILEQRISLAQEAERTTP